MIDNQTIYKKLILVSQLMEIHNQNEFKIKSYTNVGFTIKKLGIDLASMSAEQIKSIKGIGNTISENIIELIQTKELKLLNELLSKTPDGIVEMLKIKGIGPKKIATIWKELEINSVGELLYACTENKLSLYKGFGAKTQANIQESIEFYFKSKGQFLYAEVEEYAFNFLGNLKKIFPKNNFQFVGDFIRQLETISNLEIVSDIDYEILKQAFNLNEYEILSEEIGYFIEFKTIHQVSIKIYTISKNDFTNTCFKMSGSIGFINQFMSSYSLLKNFKSEEDIFQSNQLQYIPAPLREDASIIQLSQNNGIPPSIQFNEIKGIIHCHSTWSDGFHSLEEMVKAAIEKGFEYLVISDHSKTAVYANGLSIERVIAQHQEIDKLNKIYAPFKIFKSIESDILNNGDLDYPDEILNSFDLVIASIHSNLTMDLDKSMPRLIKAIENRYTTILGHLTGRLILSRAGYPIDYNLIFDACKANGVVIEINANPRRLDIDWRTINQALDKGIMLSIDPDAHSIKAFMDIHYGIKIAQKTLLTKEKNLSSFNKENLQQYILSKK